MLTISTILQLTNVCGVKEVLADVDLQNEYALSRRLSEHPELVLRLLLYPELFDQLDLKRFLGCILKTQESEAFQAIIQQFTATECFTMGVRAATLVGKDVQLNSDLVPEVKLVDVGLSQRYFNLTRRNEVHTLRDLLTTNRKVIKEWRGLGRVGMEELDNLCAKYGYRVGQFYTPPPLIDLLDDDDDL